MILVTGASGFLGQHLIRHLAGKGLAIRALYHAHKPVGDVAQLPGIEWQCRDLLDIYDVAEAMEGITHIYHCAAIVTFDARKRHQMLHFNPGSTAHLVDEALERGIEKMVHISSIAALGRSVENKTITEEEEWGESAYNSAYGLSKYLAEAEVWRGIGEGLNAAILNPGIILGAGDWDKGSAQLMSVVDREFPFYTHGVNGWVDVADVVRASELLMRSDISAERFILSAGNYSFREVFSAMAAALQKKAPHIYAGPLMTGIVWRLNVLKSRITGKGTAITRETSANAHALSYYDNSKFLQSFPDFRYTSLPETIGEMARIFTAQKIKK